MTFRCRIDGVDADCAIEADGARFTSGDLAAERWIPWVDVDRVDEDGRGLVWHIGSGVESDTASLRITHVGEKYDEYVDTMRIQRGAARRAALAQTPRDPIGAFESRRAEEVTDVIVLPQALSIELRGGAATYLPWGLVTGFTRDGYAIHFATRGLGDLVVGGFGARTDEFIERVEKARSDVDDAVRSAYEQNGVRALSAPDGWTLPASEGGAAVVEAWSGLARAEQMGHLRDKADEVRPGMWTEGGAVVLPFVLARVGERTAVEAVAADDRATFVFSTGDLERLNTGLILTSFRREVLSLDAAELGPLVVAVRTTPAVRWLRSQLIARVVHDEKWAERLESALIDEAEID